MAVKRRKGSEFWYLRGEVNKEPYFVSSKVVASPKQKTPPYHVLEMDMALRAEIELRQTLASKGRVTGEHLTPSVDLLEKMFFAKKARKQITLELRQTYEDNWVNIKKVIKTMEDCSTSVALEHYVQTRKSTRTKDGKGFISYATIRKELTVFYCAWRAAVEMDVPMPKEPGRPQNLKKDRKNLERRGKYRTPRQIRNFIRTIKDQHNKDRALLIAQTGLRDAECARLHLVRKVVRRRVGGMAGAFYLPPEATKAKKGRWVPLTKRAWAAWHRSVPFKNRSAQKAFETANAKLGHKPGITERDLRTSFATGCMDHGTTRTAVNAVDGHWRDVSDTYQKVTHKRMVSVANAATRFLSHGVISKARRALAVHGQKRGKKSKKLEAV